MSYTLVLIVFTASISALAWSRPIWVNQLIYHGPSVAHGQWWRLLTHGFIHADFNHLLFNMITLFFFGRYMEQVLVPHIGALGFVLFYLVGILVAILPSHLRHYRDPRYRSLGASGAVSSVLFAYILLRPWSMLLVMFIPVPAIIFALLYVGYSVWASRHSRGNINHSAHLWGGIWGVSFLVALEPRLIANFLEQLAAGW